MPPASERTVQPGSWQMNSKKILHILTSAAGEAVNLLLIAAMLVFIGLGVYRIWNDYQIERSAVAENYAAYRPEYEDDSPGFEELKSINPDVVGWVTVYGTNIDYPVVQGADNWAYLNTDAMRKYSLTGSIYLDHQNSPDLSDFNSILYGHNMTPAVMFGNIKDFRETAYFETHRYGEVYFGDRYQGVEFFCTIECDAYDGDIFAPGIEKESEKKRYLELLKKHSVQNRDIDIGPGDRIILLSTCSPVMTNIRDILVGKITDELFEDPYAQEPRINDPAHFDRVKGSDIPSGSILILIIVVLAAAIAALVLILAIRKKRAGK